MDNRLKSFFIYLIILSPLIDIIFIINSNYLGIDFPIHQIVRGVILLVNLFFIYKFKEYKIIAILISFLMINEIVYLLNGNLLSVNANVGYILKILYTVSFIQIYYILLSKKFISVEEVVSSLVKASLIISFVIVASKITNTGLKTYGNTSSYRTGVKGLFYAHNSITATLLILLPICFYVLYKRRNITSLFNVIINFLALNFIGTKMGVIGSFFILLLVSVITLIELMKNQKIKKKNIYILSIVIGVIFTIMLIIFKDYFITLYEQQKQIYIKYKYKNIFSLLVSNRDLQISYLKTYIGNNGIEFLSFIFGLGYSKANSVLTARKQSYKVIEMDFAGVLYYSGIFVLALILFIIIRNLYHYMKIQNLIKSNYFQKTLLISFFIAIIHAALGGHVIYEAITGTYFGIVLALLRHSSISLSDSK
jgi:succinate dehydrogenase hydrophobic anchor subunit